MVLLIVLRLMQLFQLPDPIEKVAPKIINLRIFEKESLAAKFKAYEK